MGKAAEFTDAVAAARATGATVLTGGALIGLAGAPGPRGSFARPTTPHAPTHGGTALSGGPHGEACYPLLRATHLQAVSIGNDVHVARALTTVEGLPAD